MTQPAGTMLGPYRIDALVGVGGMGEVYAATDTRLDRKVAVKVLPEGLASDADRRKRFEREARAISSLSHPHIAALYDVGEQSGTHFLVMELVSGQTLDERLQRGKLPLRQALEYATQIADALDKAHQTGVVHRDLKPGNIMLGDSGVKLLDFGLAKLKDDGVAASKYVTLRRSPLTSEGTILGTLQYMAPEQLEGKDVDARADIFAFGTILYEMLSGTRAFEADSAAGLTAAILTAEPRPLSALGPVSPALENLVGSCLAKDRKDRWQTAHDVGKQLDWIRASLTTSTNVGPTEAPASRMKLWGGAAAAVLAAAVVIGVVLRPQPAPPAQLMRLNVTFGDDVRYSIGEDFLRSASISPDGERIVFTGVDVATGIARLYIRPIGALPVSPVPGSEGATEPFWAPDGNAVGFYTGGKVLLATLAGGPPREIAAATSTGGASWNDDDQILISLQNPGPLMLLPAAGGMPRAVTTLEPGDIDHDWPQFLDDGDHFIYVSRGRTTADNKMFVSSLTSPERTLLMEGAFAFTYASPNWLIFLRGGVLLAQRFDTRRFELLGQPIALADDAQSPFSASRTGALTYRSVPSRPSSLLWLQRDGTLIGEATTPGHYTDPVFSPDGTQVALATRESTRGTYDVAILDVASRALRPLTLDPAHDRAPVWSPDGTNIVFLSTRPSAPGLYKKTANGVGAEELFLPSLGVVWPYQWTRDHLFYFAGISGSNDIGMLATSDLTERTMLIETPFNDVDGALSPDGRWFAYTSNESGKWDLYLTTFPPSSTKLPITTRGGADPFWSPDGTELYYTKVSTAELMSVPVTPGDPPMFGAHRRIHPGPFDYPAAHSAAIEPNGQRLLVAPSFDTQGDLTVLVNWQSAQADP